MSLTGVPTERISCALPRRDAGLTLLEVLVATAIVLATCVAVTTVTLTATRGASRAERTTAADGALLAEAARLRALDYFVPLRQEWVARRDAARSAVGELFPHADVTANVDDARFVDAGDRVGAFESLTQAHGFTVRRTAWMACCDVAGWQRVETTALAGWTAWGGVAVPGEGLIVCLETPVWHDWDGIADGRPLRSLTVVLTATGWVAARDALELVAPTGSARR